MKLERYGIGIAKGMAVTISHLFRHPVTVLYPEQRLNPAKRIRGNELVWNSSKCTICTTCAKSCPQGAIHLETAVDPANPNKFIVTKFEVDTGYCIFCGLCVDACPYNALFMGYAFERAKYRRGELVQNNEGLLASPERRPSAFKHPELEADLPEQTLLLYQLHSNTDKQKKEQKTETPPVSPPQEGKAEGITKPPEGGTPIAASKPVDKPKDGDQPVPPAQNTKPDIKN